MKRFLLPAICLALPLFALPQAPTAGLVAYWPMNGNFTDASPTGVNGTNLGATATTNNSGTINSAMNFNNPTATANQYATHPITTALNFSGTQNFTLSFAFYINSPFVHNCGLYDNGINYGGYGVFFWPQGASYNIQFNYKNSSLASSSIPVGVWKHVTCMRDNGTTRIYLDGVLNATGTEGTMAPAYPSPARFGSMYFNAQAPPQYNPLHGKLDEMRIYNRALTQAEVTQVYNSWLSPVPVKLTQFSAIPENGQVRLNWQTATEQNSHQFVVEKSTDGRSFSPIATVAAAGNSVNIRCYSWVDAANNTNGQMLYYRLLMQDLDGRSEYSQVVKIQNSNSAVRLLVYPNPVADKLQLQVNTGGLVSIFTAAGQLVWQQKLARGTHSVTLAGWPKGVYLVKTEDGASQQILKE